jgi:hypothetical protein
MEEINVSEFQIINKKAKETKKAINPPSDQILLVINF